MLLMIPWRSKLDVRTAFVADDRSTPPRNCPESAAPFHYALDDFRVPTVEPCGFPFEALPLSFARWSPLVQVRRQVTRSMLRELRDACGVDGNASTRCRLDDISADCQPMLHVSIARTPLRIVAKKAERPVTRG